MFELRLPPLLLLAATLGAPLLPAQDAATETRETFREWLRTEKQISQEQSAWKAEKEILADRIALLETEKEALEERIASAEERMSQAEGKRSDLTAERESALAAMASIRESLPQLEARAKALAATFPPPLREEISKLIQRIPENPENTRLSSAERLQAVIGILSQADKFNSGVSVVAEIRDIGGRQAEVRTVYFGLGGAYFSDDAGSYAGVGIPVADGWEWEVVEGLGPAVTRLLGVYDGGREASFTDLPVHLRD